jgi:hypothetical protein
MLRGLGIAISPILALLLVVMTPVGTAQGPHQDQVLDPLFPHVHRGYEQARIALATPPRVLEPRAQGPALGAGSGADSATFSLGLTPPLPGALALELADASVWRLAPDRSRPPHAFRDPPPDPPPTPA